MTLDIRAGSTDFARLAVLHMRLREREATILPPEPSLINDQQRAFFRSEAPEVLYSGAFRAGKSRVGCEKAYWLARRYPGIPIGIFRKTNASLAASTETTLVRDRGDGDLPPRGVIPRRDIARSNSSEHWYELRNGSRIYLMGLEEDKITGLPSRVGSVTLGWAFIDEAAEVTEADWTQVKGRLSWPGIPYHQLAGATNPAAPKHWLKRRFTPPSPTREYLHAGTLDNPALPADYTAEQASMAAGYFRDRYVLGEWTAAEGQIWLLPDAQVRADPGPFRRIVAGVDWGFVHAFACEVIGQTGGGRLAVIDEVYERGRTPEQLIAALKFVHERHGIEAFYADPSEPAYIAMCRQAGLPMQEAPNDVVPGITAVSTAIAHGMTVAPTCTGLLNEILGYTWQQGRNGVTERPIEVGDDAADALRYAVFALSGAMRRGWGAVEGQVGGMA